MCGRGRGQTIVVYSGDARLGGGCCSGGYGYSGYYRGCGYGSYGYGGYGSGCCGGFGYGGYGGYASYW